MKNLTYLLGLVLLFACSQSESNTSKKKAIDPINAALPHGDTMAIQELSPADKVKLSQAKGRTAGSIAYTELQEALRPNDGNLYIFNFWALNCSDCLELNQHLEKLADEMESASINIYLINLDPASELDYVNTYIREKNILNPVLQLTDLPTQLDWESTLIDGWNGLPPATYFTNATEGVQLFYQHKFDYEELIAMVQPLML